MYILIENDEMRGFVKEKEEEEEEGKQYIEINEKEFNELMSEQSQGLSLFYDKKTKKIDSIKLNQYETFNGTTISVDIVSLKNSILDVLSKLKIEYAQKEFLFQDKYWQKNRDVDKANLTSIVVMLNATKQTEFKNWKFKDLNNIDVYVDITIPDMLNMANTMQSQTTKALITESTLIAKLETLSVEELKKFDSIAEFKALIEV